MRGKIKSARKNASKLHGATGTYVSLVGAGANETPFTLIKSKEGAKAMAIKKRGKAQKSHKPLKGRKNAAPEETRTETLVAKIVADGEVFETEAEVMAYVEEAEWDAEKLEVTKNDDGDWEVRSDGLTDDDFDEMESVTDEDNEGVEVFIGKRTVAVKGDDEDDEDDEGGDEEDDDEEGGDDDEADELSKSTPAKKSVAKAKKAAPKTPAKKAAPKTLSKRSEFVKARKEAREQTQKFDSWDARFSDGNTLAKTLKAGMEWDGLPPGYYEVQAAASSAFANIVSDEGLEAGMKQEALNKAALDFAEIVGGLDSYFDAYLEADEEVVAKAFEDESQREALAKWAEDYGDFVADPEGAAPQTEQKAVKVSKSDNPAAIDYNQLGGVVADLVQKSLDPVIGQVEDVSATVEAIASRTQTKKAGSDEDSGNATPRVVETKSGKDAVDIDTWRRETQSKGLLG